MRPFNACEILLGLVAGLAIGGVMSLSEGIIAMQGNFCRLVHGQWRPSYLGAAKSRIGAIGLVIGGIILTHMGTFVYSSCFFSSWLYYSSPVYGVLVNVHATLLTAIVIYGVWRWAIRDVALQRSREESSAGITF